MYIYLFTEMGYALKVCVMLVLLVAVFSSDGNLVKRGRNMVNNMHFLRL